MCRKATAILWIALFVIPLSNLSYASKFRLKNMPEKFAVIEGAIIEKTDQTITIMTEDSILIRGMDSIEILEETPDADKAFIEAHAPDNTEYQQMTDPDYGKEKTEDKEPVKTTYGYPSVAKPGEKHLLRFQYDKGYFEYIITQATMEMKMMVHDREMPMTMNMHSVIQSYVSQVDKNGDYTLKTKLDTIEAIMHIMGQRQHIPVKDQIKNDMATLKFSSRGELLEGTPVGMPTDKNSVNGFLAMGLDQCNAVALPENEVAVGDEWSTENKVEIPEIEDPLVFKVDNTLKDIVDIDGNPTAVIESRMSFTGDDFEIPLPNAIPGEPTSGKMKADQFTITKTFAHFFSLETNRTDFVLDTTETTIKFDSPDQGSLEMQMTMNMKIETSDTKPRK